MADTVRGILTWNRKTKRPLVEHPTRKGRATSQVQPEQLAPDLAAPRAEPQQVDLELEDGQPRRVRTVGAAWTAAPPPQPPGPRPDHSQGGGAGGSSARPGFHNPYGFIRMPDRVTVEGELGDRPPESHGWFAPDRWSGRIRVDLAVETPLLIPDAAEVATNNERHKTYPVRLGPDGLPYLPPTSVKGMLRAAYEAVTNSRFGVFTGHDRRLGFRMAATEGLAMVPGRIVGDRVELLMGTNPNLPGRLDGTRWQVPTNVMYAAWLPRYRGEQFNIRYADRSWPRHKDPVRFWAELIRHRTGRFAFWEVRRIARAGEPLPPKPTPRAGGEVRDFTGWVCITNQNINRKHDERVFFADCTTGRRSHALTCELQRQWQDLVAEYRELHKGDIEKRDKEHKRPDQYLGHEPGKTAFSRHVYTEEDRTLADGALVYVRLDENQKPVGLYPVMIARELHSAAPIDLVDASLRPAETIDKLSPADRVFGWVRQEGTEGLGAYRGNLRVGPIECKSADAVQRFQAPVPLAILGQPKPNQARFYVASGNGQALSGQPVRNAYRQGNRLQGRKAYPHHATLNAAHWDDAQEDKTGQPRANGTYQEYRRAGNKANDQNRSVTGWVKPKTVFTFDIHVTNLSDVELGALLWLLDLGSGNRPRFHRLGGGKPLGFGSVRLTITGNTLATGDALADRYRTFSLDALSALDPARVTTLISAFQTAVTTVYPGGEFERVPFIADFLVAARGFGDGRPIHYPRATPAPSSEGENFKWFQENERGPRMGPSPLSIDGGLPFYTEGQYRR